MLGPLLDRYFLRQPFEGGSARRYARDERPAFGDLDERLLDALDLGAARRLLDLGCGPGTFAALARRRHPALAVIAIDPSRHYATRGVVRAAGEALPLASGSIDVALCLSSIRHVRDRAATLRELRRVIDGKLVIVELDPAAEPHRVAAHADHLRSSVMRRVFAPLVLRTAPRASVIRDLAVAAGFTVDALRADPVQPVYILELR